MRQRNERTDTLGEVGVLVVVQFDKKHLGDTPMNQSHFTVDHVRVATGKPFEEVAEGIERQLGRFDPEVYKPLTAGGAPGTVRAGIEAMEGSSGFMLFGKHDHGLLLRIAGQKRKAVQYVLGNPLFAVRMTEHDSRASLYAPLRVLLYENEERETCLEYDKPSSLFGQFANAEITAVATMLDRKMEVLAAKAIG
jgi:uncharacterized protein (DUF302 family)